MKYTEKQRKIIKLRRLELELFYDVIKDLIYSNNIDEMNTFVKYLKNKEVQISLTQFIYKKLYELAGKKIEQKEIFVDYEDIDRKIYILKKESE